MRFFVYNHKQEFVREATEVEAADHVLKRRGDSPDTVFVDGVQCYFVSHHLHYVRTQKAEDMPPNLHPLFRKKRK